MIDIEKLRNNPDEVKKATKRRGYDASVVDTAIEADEDRRTLIQEVEPLRHEANTIAQKGKDITKEDKKRGKELKKEIKEKEDKLETAEYELNSALGQIPNILFEEVPDGGAENNIELRTAGKKREFSFTPKDHIVLAEEHDLIDFEAGAKVSGSQFYYLKNEAALLEIALINYAVEKLVQKGFTPIITPDLARERFYKGTGFMPQGEEAQIYEVDGEDLGLIATAEVTMAGYHADEIFNAEDLPKKYVALSHCFRKEAGAYGKESKGLYRVHQFTKVEMFAYTTPEESRDMHEEFVEIEEEIFQELGLPYRVVVLAAEDTGAQSAKTYDLEVFMPGRSRQTRQGWGEVTSTSNTTDYQARNMNTRYRTSDGTAYVHMLNGTAIATSRAIIAILENYQQEDGSIVIPEVLQKYVPFDSIGDTS